MNSGVANPGKVASGPQRGRAGPPALPGDVRTVGLAQTSLSGFVPPERDLLRAGTRFGNLRS